MFLHLSSSIFSYVGCIKLDSLRPALQSNSTLLTKISMLIYSSLLGISKIKMRWRPQKSQKGARYWVLLCWLLHSRVAKLCHSLSLVQQMGQILLRFNCTDLHRIKAEMNLAVCFPQPFFVWKKSGRQCLYKIPGAIQGWDLQIFTLAKH